MPRKPPLLPEDKALFREHVRNVTRLEQDKIQPPRKRLKPHPLKFIEDEKAVVVDMLSDAWHPDELETGDELWYARDGVQPKVLRKLRRGQFSIAGELDLHGMTVREARQAVAQFIRHWSLHGSRCVRIIHGKGISSGKPPVLKGKLYQWLQQLDDVVAFSTAMPHDGGTGAMYVLLKSRLRR